MANAIVFESASGQTLYARIYTAPSTALAVALSAGTGGNSRFYFATDEVLAGAGLSGVSTYPYTVFAGSPSTTASDSAVGSGLVRWNEDKSDPQASSAGLTYIKDIVDNVVGLIDYQIPYAVNQVAIPDSRRFILERIGTSLIAKSPKGITVGDETIFAIDFRHELAPNGRLYDIYDIKQLSGPTYGMDWNLLKPDNAAIDKQSAIIRLTAITAGTYEMLVTVIRAPGAGGGKVSGKFTLVATV